MSSEDHPTRPVEGSLGPIARVRVDLGVMHLDRDFDYLVPDEWRERAVPGARVRVRFSGRLRDAYVIDRVHEPDVDSPKPLERVIDAGWTGAACIARIGDVVKHFQCLNKSLPSRSTT